MSLIRVSALDCAFATKAATLSRSLFSGFGLVAATTVVAAAAVTGCTAAKCSVNKKKNEYE